MTLTNIPLEIKKNHHLPIAFAVNIKQFSLKTITDHTKVISINLASILHRYILK